MDLNRNQRKDGALENTEGPRQKEERGSLKASVWGNLVRERKPPCELNKGESRDASEKRTPKQGRVL